MEQTPSEARLEEYQDYWVKTQLEEDGMSFFQWLAEHDMADYYMELYLSQAKQPRYDYIDYLEDRAENITDIPEGWEK